LPGFSITVAAAAASGGTVATLAWSEPTQNDDGTPLTDLVGYHVYVGPDASHLTSQVNIATAATTNYAISGLVSGTTYYFAVTAVNSAGQESALSNVASQVI
jgi:fibronectin type 3 domain-containing protein